MREEVKLQGVLNGQEAGGMVHTAYSTARIAASVCCRSGNKARSAKQRSQTSKGKGSRG